MKKELLHILIVIALFIMIQSCKKQEIPALSTADVIEITATSAKCGGNIINDGGTTVIARGICWSIETSPTINDNKTSDGAGAGGFSSNMTSLNGGTTYFVRAYATNSFGTGYGMTMSFKTLGQLPVTTTQPAINITTSSATLNGIVNANYLATTASFEYGTTISYGQIVYTTPDQVTGIVNTNVIAEVLNLSGGTIYHFRIKTVNALGITYGSDMTFTTLGQLPTTLIQQATNITPASAILNGIVNANYLSTEVSFEYGISTGYGNSIAANPNPIIGSTNTSVNANIFSLSPSTIYHFRIKAVNYLGTIYSNDMTFSTLYNPITDQDGNVYNIINIGSQVWMKENLKTTKFNDGLNIPLVTDNSAWSTLTTSAYCWYNNDETSHKPSYGAIYNWFSVNTGKLCPSGWHVPTNSDWTALADFLGGNNVAGGKLKELGTSHWISPNVGATNESSFTALPGGARDYSGIFASIGIIGIYWSSTELDAISSGNRYVYYNYANFIISNNGKTAGYSVRCLKD